MDTKFTYRQKFLEARAHTLIQITK